jgi:hypothetical protein
MIDDSKRKKGRNKRKKEGREGSREEEKEGGREEEGRREGDRYLSERIILSTRNLNVL